jgi:hypothetical protein
MPSLLIENHNIEMWRLIIEVCGRKARSSYLEKIQLDEFYKYASTCTAVLYSSNLAILSADSQILCRDLLYFTKDESEDAEAIYREDSG